MGTASSRGRDGMARRAGEPSAKRQKVDEADEEEDPLVRRKEEVVVALKEARSREDARAERVARRELVTLCERLEAKNEERFRRLPAELWEKIVDENVHQNDMVALAMTCRFFREKQKDLGWKVETELKGNNLVDELQRSGNMASHSLGWFRWVCDTFQIQPGFWWSYGRVKGAVYEGDLVNYAALQGSVEILSWLVEEKGWKLTLETDMWAGMRGSIEVLEYMRGKGYVFKEDACAGAARGGHLEALKYLRGLDPPCPWNRWTLAEAAYRGHLEVLKWARSENPPCPWGEVTSGWAAEGGQLDVLEWARGQNPPCPWNECTFALAARGGPLEALKWLRDQDPPCPWGEDTCRTAVEYGRLDVLKWLRGQDPPCPWNERTCVFAARGGNLEALKWARSQDPPCPWSRSYCRLEASWSGHKHILDWIDQQEDDSDVSDTD